MAMHDFSKLRKLLAETEEWPTYYMFKFIVPNQHGKVDKVTALLPEHGEVSFNHTKSLRYVSVTCKATMNNPDEIVKVTQEATAIEGVFSL
ncbi:MAG: DUF493 family protein [Bacteroidota bacterium]